MTPFLPKRAWSVKSSDEVKKCWALRRTKYRQKFSRAGKLAIIHKVNLSGHMSIWTIFSFGVWTSCLKLVPIFHFISLYAEGFKISHPLWVWWLCFNFVTSKIVVHLFCLFVRHSYPMFSIPSFLHAVASRFFSNAKSWGQVTTKCNKAIGWNVA
jgi:hypothetical protein